MKTVEIICSGCGADTMLRREPVYEGFQKTGEKLTCVACGHVYASEDDVPFKLAKAQPVVFTDADRSEKIEVFGERENARLCRHCANYIVNPFTQFCAIHRRETQATDSCSRFEEPSNKDPDPSLP